MEQLPNELILEICNKLDIPDLINFINTSTHLNVICMEVFNKKINPLKKEILFNFDDYFNHRTKFFYKFVHYSEVEIKILKLGNSRSVYIEQHIPKEIKDQIPWILPDYQPDKIKNKKLDIVKSIKLDIYDSNFENIITELVANLITQNYEQPVFKPY